MVRNTRNGQSLAFAILAALSATSLAGCMSSPTYGTDKTANEQLVDDLSGMLSLAPKKGPRIDYEPRPELVKPADTNQLPQPQEDIVSAREATGQWPESPEERRARYRKYATENRDNPDFEPIVTSGREADPNEPMITSGAAAQRGQYRHLDPSQTPVFGKRDSQAEFRRRRAENMQGSPASRKYLSEPPLKYRVPAATAPAGEFGEDEADKERRLKAESRKKAGKTSWRDMLPW
ncbi:hypothetical protein CSC94_14870 [Zhengella mangrovi]|uniref:DUF3035 domain-containing protein n=2 Tax=Zhengella mangrovi TaxID=1982044 RepID=A0A2G1QLC0_9HYPH|nr:hypothetical protein CSC94_14870 [Zhengella mangrovi]